MAGVKGKSGGPRKNAGGARPGAGRKPKAPPKESANKPVDDPALPADTDMLTHLQNIALGVTEASNIQVRAAIAAVQYTHTKRGEGGKKEEKDKAARQAGAGKFQRAAPPLKLVGKK